MPNVKMPGNCGDGLICYRMIGRCRSAFAAMALSGKLIITCLFPGAGSRASVFLTWVALPFAGFQNAGWVFVLALLVMALAVYKQKFDGRPAARFWQQRPRQRWGETMEHLLREAFDRS